MERSNDKYFDTLIDDCHIYTYAINVAKTFSDGKAEQTMFDHVLFKAQNKTDGYYVIAALNETEAFGMLRVTQTRKLKLLRCIR